MPLPGDVNTITLTGHYEDMQGNPQAGTVTFTPNAGPFSDGTASVIFEPVTISVTLDGTGSFSVVLPCTDNTDFAPPTWAWTVTERVTGSAVRTYGVLLPHTLGSTVSLAAVTPVNPPGPISTTYGVLAQPNTWAGLNTFPGGVAAQGVTDWLNVVTQYGADPTGGADSTGAIQAALTAAYAPGLGLYGTVYLPAGTYKTTAPLMIPPAITLIGAEGNVLSLNNHGAVIKPSAAWAQGGAAAAAVLLLLNQTDGSYSGVSEEQTVHGLVIDGSSLAVTADGIQSYGAVNNVRLRDVAISNVTGYGLNQATARGASANTWRGAGVVVRQSGLNAFLISSGDSTWVDCHTLGSGTAGNYDGWAITNSGNSHWIGCRSEWSTGNGFGVTSSTTFNLAFTKSFTGCSTDRNNYNGFLATGTNKTAINVTGCYFHRDGRNVISGTETGGGGYAAINVAAYAGMVTFSGCSTAPGVDDSGSGADSPEYALSVTGANGAVVASGCVLHGFTAAVNYDGASTFLQVTPSCIYATGADSGPTYDTSPYARSRLASANGFQAEAFPLAAATGAAQATTNGTLYLIRVDLPQPIVINKLWIAINAGATGVTGGENFMGIYSSAGALLASASADALVATTSGGSVTLSAPLTVGPGFVWVALVVQASGAPTLLRGITNGALANLNLTAASFRVAANGTGITTGLPGTITPSSNTATGSQNFWMGVS